MMALQAPHVWLCTGTPFQLKGGKLNWAKQLALLGHGSGTHDGLGLGSKPITDELIDDIKKLMIRHSKSQRIHGEQALALPDADLQTTMLRMTHDEQILYNAAAVKDGQPAWLHPQFPRPWLTEQQANLTKGIEKRLRCCANCFEKPEDPGPKLDAYERLVGVRAMARVRNRAEFSKMKALLEELRKVVSADPTARVVVFTQFDEVQQLHAKSNSH